MRACAVNLDRNLNPKLAIMRQCTSITDRRTEDTRRRHVAYRASLASRGKNRPYCTEHQVLLPGNERRLIAN